MSKDTREYINKIRKWEELLAENLSSWWYDIRDKLNLLKSYIHILNNSEKKNDVNYDSAINYFRIIHNFLIIERMFYPMVVKSNKEINKNLDITKLNNENEVMEKFYELYDNNHDVKFGVETLDSIEEVRVYLKQHPNVYTELM